jgi:hypothetical protein
LTSAQVIAFDVELRDKTVMAFPPERVEKVTLQWPGRTLAVRRLPTPKGVPPEWQPEPGYDPSGVDLSRLATAVASINDLKASRFVQDSGPIPTMAGLAPSRLAFAIQIAGEAVPRSLRIGNTTDDGQVLATTATGSEGPLFVIPQNPAWAPFLILPGRANDMPDNVFAPEPEKPAPAH